MTSPAAELDPLGGALLRPVRGHHAFEACVEQLATAIRLGAYPSGSALPAERELAQRLGVSPRHPARGDGGAAPGGPGGDPRGRGGGTVVTRRPAVRARTAARRRTHAAPSCSTRWPSAASSSPVRAPWPPADALRTAGRSARRRPRGGRRGAPARLAPPGRLAAAPGDRDLSGSPRWSRRSPQVQASLHEHAARDPGAASANIAHSDRQHARSSRAVLAGRPARPAARWSSTATTPPRCCADCSA